MVFFARNPLFHGVLEDPSSICGSETPVAPSGLPSRDTYLSEQKAVLTLEGVLKGLGVSPQELATQGTIFHIASKELLEGISRIPNSEKHSPDVQALHFGEPKETHIFVGEKALTTSAAASALGRAIGK